MDYLRRKLALARVCLIRCARTEIGIESVKSLPSAIRFDQDPRVVVAQLRVHADERRPKPAPRCPIFQKFGQVYMTTAYSGVVKAWHLHRVQADHFAVVLGMIKLVLYDDREGSPTKGALYVFYLGEHSPVMVRVPPLVFHGFKAVNETEAIVINVSTEPYDPKNPDEYRLPPHTDEIPYDWARKDG